MNKFTFCNMRAPSVNKQYVLKQIDQFCDHVKDLQGYDFAELGKQDQRGGFSIVFYSDSEYKKQVCFDSKDQMIGFISGFNVAFNKGGF